MIKLKINIHCESDDDWLGNLLKEAERIEKLMNEGYEVEINMVVKGARGAVFKEERAY